MTKREQKQRESIYNHVKQVFLLRHPYCEDCLDPVIFNYDGKRRKTWNLATHFVQDQEPDFEGENFKNAIDMRHMHNLCTYHYLKTIKQP